MNWRDFLKKEFEERKKINSRYSLRTFAHFLQMSPGQLSKIFSHKKNVSPKYGIKLSELFGLSATETLLMLQSSHQLLPKKKNNIYLLKNSEMNLLSEWYCFAILGLAHLKYNHAHPDWISQKLNISPILAKKTFELLLQKQFIVIKNGQFRQKVGYIRTPEDYPSLSLRKYHKQILHLASESLDQVPIEKREVGSMTMAINKKRIPIAKKLIRQFMEEFTEEVSQGSKNEVFNLSVQFFPLSLT